MPRCGGRAHHAEGTARAKVLGQNQAWCVGEQRRCHVAGAEWVREREGGGEGRVGIGQVVQGLRDHGEDLDLDLDFD